MEKNSLVPGIYNYCDRWCERCKFQLCCLSFLMGKKLKEKATVKLGEEIPDDEEASRLRLKNVLDSTLNVLQELAKEQGKNIEEIYLAEKIDTDFWGEDYEDLEDLGEKVAKKVENEDMIKCEQIYHSLSENYQKKMYEWFHVWKDRQGDTPRIREMENALVEADWYTDLLRSKMKRALHGYFLHVEKTGTQQDNQDYNGSAKVMLLSVENAREAWLLIRDKMPAFDVEASRLIVLLDELEGEVNAFFPDARAFKRPGFDA